MRTMGAHLVLDAKYCSGRVPKAISARKSLFRWSDSNSEIRIEIKPEIKSEFRTEIGGKNK